MSRTVVTTSHRPDNESVNAAMTAAAELKTVFVERNRMSLARIREKYGIENVLVVTGREVKLFTPLGEYFFHPSMSVPRLKAIKQGKPDHMVEAMSLKPGDWVLDCTLGLASDAIVAAAVAGPNGRVVGVEICPELAYMVRIGLKNYCTETKILKEAVSRVEVWTGDCNCYLAELPDRSFDIVYFDPMFRYPRIKSSSMEPLRGIMNSEPIHPTMIREAVRVARKRVVMKENWFSKEFERLGFLRVTGGKYSPVAYGIIDRREGDT